MSFPAPDIGVARFPGPDTGVARFPGPDIGSAAFPPAPTPVIFINGETVIDILSEGVAIGVPWNVFETVVDINSAAIAVASVEILAATTIDILSAVQQIFDVVTSETVVDISSTATVSPSPTVITGTSVDVTSAAIVGAPAAIVLAETLVDITSDVISIPVTSFIGTTTVDIASTAIVIPVGVISSTTSVDIASTGTIIAFTPAGVILPTANSWTSTTPRKSLGWSADSAFPGTVVVSDGIQVNGSKVATVAFDLTYRWAWTGSVNVAAYVAGVKRGSTVSWTNPDANADYNKTGEITVTVSSGETVDLYIWTSHSFAFTMRNTSKWSIT